VLLNATELRVLSLAGNDDISRELSDEAAAYTRIDENGRTKSRYHPSVFPYLSHIFNNTKTRR
jgi:hypothetical protein